MVIGDPTIAIGGESLYSAASVTSQIYLRKLQAFTGKLTFNIGTFSHVAAPAVAAAMDLRYSACHLQINPLCFR